MGNGTSRDGLFCPCVKSSFLCELNEKIAICSVSGS